MDTAIATCNESQEILDKVDGDHVIEVCIKSNVGSKMISICITLFKCISLLFV